MSRPFLLFHSTLSGGELFAQLLVNHPHVKILGEQLDKNQWELPRSEEARQNLITRFWGAYENEVRQARGVMIPIDVPHTHWPQEGSFRDMILGHNPEIFVLRDDDIDTHAARRFAKSKKVAEGETISAELKEFDHFLKTVKRDDHRLNAGLPNQGPIFEVARNELFDTPQTILDGAAKRLGLCNFTLEPEQLLPEDAGIDAYLKNPEIADAFA